MAGARRDATIGGGVGLLVGAVDALLAVHLARSMPGAPPPMTVVFLLVPWVGGLLALPAMLGGLLAGPPLRAVSASGLWARVGPGTPAGRRLFLAWVVLGLLAAAVGMLVVRPDEDATDPRPLLLSGCGGLALVALGRMVPRGRSRGAAVPCLAALGAIAWATTALPGRVPPTAYQTFRSSTSLASALFDELRGLADGDGDGFPASPFFCAALDCDCDDTSAHCNPAAAEIPGNGRDEDCDGKDLAAAAGSTPGMAVAAAPAAPAAHAASLPHPAPASGSPHGQGRPPESILLITVDALRADHVGCYGHDRNTTPNLDALAKESVVFLQARAQGPMTRFSIPSLLVGRYFTEIRRAGDRWPVLHEENVTFAEVLRAAGYHTAAFHAHGYFARVFGMHQGFDVWDLGVYKEREPVHWRATSDALTDHVLRHIEGDLPRDRPALLWVHYIDPHAGWIRHPGLPSFGPRLQDRYDQEILFTDLHIGRLLDRLRELGLLDRFVTVVTADHGEGLDRQKDHGWRYHGQTLFDNLIRVPLLVRRAGSPPRRVSTPVGLVDLFPTFLELAGVTAPPPGLRGVSLVPYLEGLDPPHPPVFSEKPYRERLPEKAMVTWPFKVIWNLPLNRFSLYDLAADPEERTDLLGTGRAAPATSAPLIEALRRWRATVLEEIAPE